MMALDELVRRAKACAMHHVAYDIRFELCSGCTLEVCDPKGKSCAVKKYRNARTAEAYKSNPRQQQRNRTSNLTPEQRQKRLDAHARYYEENKDAWKIKAVHKGEQSKPPPEKRAEPIKPQGKEPSLRKIALSVGMNPKTLAYRLNNDMTLEQALKVPVVPRRPAGKTTTDSDQRGCA